MQERFEKLSSSDAELAAAQPDSAIAAAIGQAVDLTNVIRVVMERAHSDGLSVEFIAEAISALAVNVTTDSRPTT